VHRAAVDRQGQHDLAHRADADARHATTSKNDVNYMVTEFGVAQLRDKSAKQRAQALIAIAHPDFRASLREAANKMCVF
jgi:acyl-CoA hydrolase